MPPASAVGETAIVLIFAFVGVEIALVPSGEVRDPARTVPRALFAALAITTTLYLLIQTVAQGLLGPAIADICRRAARRSGRPGARQPADACSSWPARRSRCSATCRATCSAARARCSRSRATASCRRRVARIHPRFHTPHVAIIVVRLHRRDCGREQQLHAARHPRERRGADDVPDVRGRRRTSCSAATSAPAARRSRSPPDRSFRCWPRA